MSYTKKFKIYFDLMKKLIEKQITPSEFWQSYMKQWDKDRDNQFIYITPEMENALREQIRKLGVQEINEKQYAVLRRKIFKITEFDEKLDDIIDRGYTTCDVYWEDATEDDIKNGQLDDEGLIKEITQIYKDLKELLKNENSI